MCIQQNFLAYCQERLISVGLSKLDGDPNSHKIPRACGKRRKNRSASYFESAPVLWKYVYYSPPRVRWEYCDSDSTISHTLFPYVCDEM